MNDVLEESIDRMLDVSTIHVTDFVCNTYLKLSDIQFAAYEFECGWFICVPGEVDETVPDCLVNIFDFARRNKCTYVKLDCDGFVHEGLQKYNWNPF